MNNLETNWKYVYGQIAIHIGKPIASPFRNVSYFRNLENPKKKDISILFLEDLLNHGCLGT
jgi:hypothetical protein